MIRSNFDCSVHSLCVPNSGGVRVVLCTVKAKPKLNTGARVTAKGGNYDDFMGDDGAGNYYDDAADYMW